MVVFPNMNSSFDSSTSTPVINKILKVTGLEDLNCTVYEINEVQDYDMPQHPLDNGTFIADTIYRLPKKIMVRVLVKDEDILSFVDAIQSVQFSNNTFTVTSIANEVFTNMKIRSYTKDVTSKVVGSQFYLIPMEEVRLVQALTQSYKSNKKPAYSKKEEVGSKEPQKQSVAKGASIPWF